MEIKKIDALEDEQIRENDCYFEFDGKFFAKCWNCGKLVEIDRHRTKTDLFHDEPGEEEYFCNAECKKKYENWTAKNCSNII